MEENVATRLKLFIDTNGLNSAQFADMCGIPRPSLSQLLSGRNKKISDVLVGQIHRAFPDLSVVWLLFGEGPVKVSSGSGFSRESSAVDKTADFSNGQREDFRGGIQAETEYSNLNAFKSSKSEDNPVDNQVFESDLKIMDLKRQIEQMKQNPRKVVQITIYYDDSTFETFVPK